MLRDVVPRHCTIMEEKRRWFFTKDQLLQTPSKADGVDESKELSYRQQTADLIQDIGQRLHTNHYCIGTAIAYMHRFYMLHSFKKYKRSIMATSALFLACKVEEQPNKLEHIIKVAYSHINPGKQISSQQEFDDMAEEVVSHELLLLETLGFDVTVKHPHVFVVRCVQLLRASKDLGQMAFFLAHNSLLLTTMCLQYSPSVIACVCIHLACRWKGIEIPRSSDDKHWWEYIDPLVSEEMLERLSDEFLGIYEKCPSKFKKKLNSIRNKQSGAPLKVELPESKSQPRAPTTSNHHPGDRPTGSQPSSSHKPAPGPLPAGSNSKLAPLSGLKQSPSSSSAGPRPDHYPKSEGLSSSATSSKPIASTARNLPILAPLTVSDQKPAQLPSLHVGPPSPKRSSLNPADHRHRKRPPSSSSSGSQHQHQPASKKPVLPSSSLSTTSHSTPAVGSASASGGGQRISQQQQMSRHHQLQQQLSSLHPTTSAAGSGGGGSVVNGSTGQKRQRTPSTQQQPADKRPKYSGQPPPPPSMQQQSQSLSAHHHHRPKSSSLHKHSVPPLPSPSNPETPSPRHQQHAPHQKTAHQHTSQKHTPPQRLNSASVQPLSREGLGMDLFSHHNNSSSAAGSKLKPSTTPSPTVHHQSFLGLPSTPPPPPANKKQSQLAEEGKSSHFSQGEGGSRSSDVANCEPGNRSLSSSMSTAAGSEGGPSEASAGRGSEAGSSGLWRSDPSGDGTYLYPAGGGYCGYGLGQSGGCTKNPPAWAAGLW